MLQIRHRTCYRYSTKVNLGTHRLLLRPRDSHHSRLEEFTLAISPSHRIRWIRDLHDNDVGLVDFTEKTSELIFECNARLKIPENNPFNFIISAEASEYPFSYDSDLGPQLMPLRSSLYVQDCDCIATWLKPYWHCGIRLGTFELLQQINGALYRHITYQRRERRGVQSPAETLEKKSGSCRDFATLFMEICRFLRLAARFVSGYMYSSEINGRMSMHAWAEVYLPGAGWIGFDPSWGILATSHYIPVAVTHHPEHIPPISGTYFGKAQDFIETNIDLYVELIGERSRPASAERSKVVEV